jgi:3-ketosteroid 9alpha-monooxygenase subunit A
MAKNFPFGIPTSWYSLANSSELERSQVLSRKCLGRELVLFRTDAGEPAVLEAYCPHLGAHLGHGGAVEGEGIRCPFHAWRFGVDGVCQAVPYAKKIPPKAVAHAYPVVERNGFLWAWFDPAGRAPWFEVPELPQVADPEWFESSRVTWTIRTQIQEMGENGSDSAHFPTVHGATALPEAEYSGEGAYRRSIQRAPIKTSKGAALSIIDVHNHGMGFGYTHFTGLTETISMNLQTPIDEDNCEFTVVFLQPESTRGSGIAKAICLDLEKQVNEDIPIWENKRHHERPVLCDGDGPISQYRDWCVQFYPERAQPSSAQGAG